MHVGSKDIKTRLGVGSPYTQWLHNARLRKPGDGGVWGGWGGPANTKTDVCYYSGDK